MRVLVTRPGTDGEALMARLTELGYDGLHEPLLVVNLLHKLLKMNLGMELLGQNLQI